MSKINKVKRLLTDEELNIFLELRENKNDKAAAKYMASLQDELFEQVEEKDLKKHEFNK